MVDLIITIDLLLTWATTMVALVIPAAFLARLILLLWALWH